MTDRVRISNDVPAWAPPFIALAAAKLGVKKSDVLTSALRVYRDYLLRSGVLTEAEASD